MKIYDVGVMALGMAGQAQVEAFAKNPRTRVKAVCTRDEDVLRDTCERHGIDVACQSFDDLLSAGLDVVVICTPDHLHVEYAAAALQAGLHVVCEKPLATSLDDVRELVNLTRRTDRLFMTGQCARFFARSQFARGLIDRGELGSIFFAEADYLHDIADFLRGWRVDPESPQDIVLGGGCHPLDLLRWLVGDVDEVHGVANKMVFPDSNPMTSDCALLSLKFVSGAIGKCVVSVGCQRPYSLGLSLYGDAGTMVDDMLHLASDEGDEFADTPLGAQAHDGADLFGDQAQHLVECLDAGRQPMADAVEGAKTVATCLAGAESIRTGRPVKVCNDF